MNAKRKVDAPVPVALHGHWQYAEAGLKGEIYGPSFFLKVRTAHSTSPKGVHGGLQPASFSSF
jgi:hypothetical protein